MSGRSRRGSSRLSGSERFERRRCSFGGAAALYDGIRPSYPAAAARWIVGEAPVRVADLGAGTGKFSRVLAELGHEVVAVEPDAEMRTLLAASLPGVEAVEGSGESIPLPDGSVDAVAAAQSFHWFANDAARAEIARIVRSGGVFGPLWNLRDDSEPWVGELSRHVLLGDGTRSPWDHSELEFGPAFGPRERAEFRHGAEHTTATLVELVRSRSQWLIAGEEERQRMEAAVADITRDLPELFVLPYVTVAYRASRI